LIISTLRKFWSDINEILTGNVRIMALSWFLFALSGALVQPFFTKYAKDLGATDLDVARMRMVAMLALSLSLIPGGFLTDTIGRVKTILIGTLGISIIQFAYAMATNWRIFAAIWVIDFAFHFYQPALNAIVMDSLPKEKTFNGFLILNIFPNVPYLFMPIVGGYLYDHYGVVGVRISFVLSGVISLIVFVLRMRGFQETFMGINKDFSKTIIELTGYMPILKKSLKIFFFTSILFQLTNSVINTYGAIYGIEVLGFNKTTWGFISSVSNVGGILSLLILFRLNIRNPKNVLMLSIGAISVSLFMMSIPYYMETPKLPIVLAALFIINLSSNIVNSSISTLLTRLIPQEIRGRTMSIKGSLDNAGASLASIVAGYIYSSLNPGEAFLITSAIGLVGLFYLYLSLKT
jgi:MFS family permease